MHQLFIIILSYLYYQLHCNVTTVTSEMIKHFNPSPTINLISATASTVELKSRITIAQTVTRREIAIQLHRQRYL